MMLPQVLRESVPTVSPLGLRFWDVATGADVTDELFIVAYPPNNSTSPPENPTRQIPAYRAWQIQAYRTWSGRYAFRNVPGLRAFETGNGDTEFWESSNQSLPAGLQRGVDLVVEVVDDARRYQPFSFEVSVPVRGLYSWTGPAVGQSPSPEGTVPMFSAPARPVPGGMAVIRATLRDGVHNTPAAWAVLEVRVADKFLARGLADEAGQIAVIFPYPPPVGPELDSPPGAQLPFAKQNWSLQFTARYGQLPSSIPDLYGALSQPLAQFWSDQGRTEPVASATLTYGQELVLRTRKAASPLDTLAELLLIPTELSPP